MEKYKVLIIGGSGSWGTVLIDELLNQNVEKIKLYARNEFQMVEAARKFDSSKVEIVIGDIRDRDSLEKACEEIDIIFHLAALKHVNICENLPYEAIETNIIGTKNVIDAAIKNRVKKVIYASTDKVVNTDCTYGCTKLLGEKLILSSDKESKYTRFSILRSGNLIGSKGSVIPLFKSQIKKNKKVTLTDRRMNRFFIPIKNASEIMIRIASDMNGGEIFIPKMFSVSIFNLAKYMLKRNEIDESNIEIIGMREGEKLNEQLVSENERENLQVYSKDLLVINNKLNCEDIHNKIDIGDFPLNSADKVLDYSETKEFLLEVGV